VDILGTGVSFPLALGIIRGYAVVINCAVGASGTDHNDTNILGTPALISERDKPITPSPVIFPRPVSEALNTINSALIFKSRIC
jgi:hypothetical protein